MNLPSKNAPQSRHLRIEPLNNAPVATLMTALLNFKQKQRSFTIKLSIKTSTINLKHHANYGHDYKYKPTCTKEGNILKQKNISNIFFE